jgi:anti-sigma regulatory factor (Ser/Thr protein kinase)
VVRWLRVWGLPEPLRETARLVVSELFTNAVLHTDSGQVVCRVEASGARLRIEVADQGLGLDEDEGDCGTPGGHGDVEAENGRGLMLVDALADSWGVITADRRAGCTVWAEIEADYEAGYRPEYPEYESGFEAGYHAAYGPEPAE